MEEKRNPSKRNKKRLLTVLLILCLAGAAVTGTILLVRSAQLRRTERKTREVRAQVAVEQTAAPEEAQAQNPADKEPSANEPSANEPTAEGEEAAEPAAETLPASDDAKEPPSEEEAENVSTSEAYVAPELLTKYEELWETLPNFAGWLTIGEEIDTPVVRGSDNVFYLDHDFTGESAWGGAIFMDCMNWLEPLNQNTLIYGHHLSEDLEDRMFGALMEYKRESYAMAHQTFYFASPWREYECTVFATYNVFPTDRLYTIDFEDEADFLAYCEEAISRSAWDYGVTVSAGDRILTLSTCDYNYSDSRYILQAVLRPLN